VLLVKKLLGLPIESNESEIKTFIDLKNHFGVDWPFMMQVKDTRKELVKVNGRQNSCISS